MKSPENLEQIRTALQQYDARREEDLVNLTRTQIIAILERFLKQSLTRQQVEDWADAVEGREDIEFGNDCDDITLDAIHEVANPEMEGQLTALKAKALIDRLLEEHE